MKESYHYTLIKPARLLFSSIVEKTAPRNVANAIPKFSGTFGIEKEDFTTLVDMMIKALSDELGSYSGNPKDYYLACMSGATAGKRAIQKAELDAQGLNPDEAAKIRDKANTRAELYSNYAGILTAASQFNVALARLDTGKIVEISDADRMQVGKDLFYPGAYVVPAIALKAFRQKTLDSKNGVTAYLQNCLFVRDGERLKSSGGLKCSSVFSGYAGYSDYDPTANVVPNENVEEAAF